MNFRRFFSSFLVALSLLAGNLFALPVSAQVNTGLQEVGSTIKLSSTDPRIIASNIINVALGLIGIVLVGLILYAGFLYMTSGGDEKKTTQARKIILSAIIGLILILSAWAITRYVIESLLTATGGGGGGGGIQIGGGGGFGGGFGGGGGAQGFQVKSITPSGTVNLRNVQVKLVFTRAVDESTVGAIAVLKDGGTTVGGTIAVNGSIVLFTPAQDCPAPNATKKCFDANSDFTVKVSTSLRSTQGQSVSCASFGSICQGAFHTGNSVDTQPPTVSFSYPTNGMSVPQNFLQDLQADAADDSGVATVEFFDGANSVDVDAPTASSSQHFSAKGQWDTAGASLGSHSLSASASDLDTNSAKSASVNVVVRAAHCFNHQQDASAGEAGIDCGGDPSSADFCGLCGGGTCSVNTQCSSGFCTNGVCIQQPVIQAVSPLDGQPGTFVTIKGANFGSQAGMVTFLGGDQPQDDRLATAPAACVNAGTAWTDTQVVVAVPVGAASGPIVIKNSGSGLSDATNDANGPGIVNFIANNVAHPGLCAIQPVSGTVGSQPSLFGEGFGGSAQKVKFGNTEISSGFPLWSDSKVTFTVPVVNSAAYPVSIQTGGGQSNLVTFTVVDKQAGALPELASIDPGSAPKQGYITLFGKNFGTSVGTVVFTNVQGGQDAIGDTTFPAACSAGYWRDDRIVVKVPSVYKNGQGTQDGLYRVKVIRADQKASGQLDFTLNSQLPSLPGICAIVPAVGPVGTKVQILGDRFGLSAPIVAFSVNQLALVQSNTNQQLDVSVPTGALTGPVQITAAGQKSNKVNFEVRNCNEDLNLCSASEVCCGTGECRPKGQSCGVKSTTAEYAWQTSTGQIPVAPRVMEECRPDLPPASAPTPSPSPWLGRSGGDQAPVNAPIVMRFNRLLDPATVTANAFRVYACTTDACTTKKDVAVTVSMVPENTTQEVVHLAPKTAFATSTTYLVDVLSSIKAAGTGGMTMDVSSSCGKGPNGETFGYCFRFKTRSTTDTAAVGSVHVLPMSSIVHSQGLISPAYQAEPIDAEDACIVLNCHNYNWNWFTGADSAHQDGRASVTNHVVNGQGACEQDVTAISETQQVPVSITASLSQPAVQGSSDLFINFLPPIVDDVAPHCDQACVNALIWARFNSELDKASVTLPGNVQLFQCFNQNCIESESTPVALPPGSVDLVTPFGSKGDVPRVITIDTAPNGKPLLQSGMFYRVLLKGGPNVQNGIIGANSLPISALNHPLGYQWTFRVKLAAQGGLCTAERVDIAPAEKFETQLDARQLFTATPFTKPDVCSASGQALVSAGDASWASSDEAVAKLYKPAGGLVDTTTNLPAGCSGTCLATGAAGQYGRVAVCGNGVIETTDSHYCQNQKNLKGDACTLLPVGAKAGEECEPSIDGNACDTSTCLWRPVATVESGGTCGNGVVDVLTGEACDFGPTCVGGSNATSSTPVPELSPCGNATTKTACEKAGGSCSMHVYRGCSTACRHLGSESGKTTCGNGDALGDGKDCDDGNVTSGDGCSPICLHEPSAPSAKLVAVCGNGVLEPGETCEASLAQNVPIFPAGCDHATCLHAGKIACTSPTDANCCGNGKIETGEDCDDSNHVSGDSCSSSCLLEGSSVSYSANGAPTPSFCGDGILEVGEQCEVGATSDKIATLIGYEAASPSLLNVLNKKYGIGDGKIDSKQLAVIIGKGTPDPNTGKMSTEISATMEGQKGTATYGLQCGFTDEASCAPGFGLDAHGCCSERPMIQTPYPQGTGICRNVQISMTFAGAMDAASVVSNFEINQQTKLPTDPCPSGTHEVVATVSQPGFFNWLKREWRDFVAWLKGADALAQKWCVGGVTGQLFPIGSSTSTKAFVYALDQSLAPNTVYRVRVLGDNSTTTDPLSDNADPTKRIGVKTARGVIHPFVYGDSGDLVWTFQTGPTICTANVITVSDVTPAPLPPEIPHPYLFTNANNQPETRNFLAMAQAIQNGQSVPLSSVPEYSWKWDAWTTSDSSTVDIVSSGLGVNVNSDKADATSKQKNGNAILTATLEVTGDSVNVPSTTGQTVQGIAPVAVLVCENPWPSLQASPFRDADPTGAVPSSFQPGDAFYGGPYYNFSTMYCRDAGIAHDAADDLPALVINQVPQSNLDKIRGILRQYLFTYPTETAQTPIEYQGLQKDGIGIRIISNPQHYSPMEWYRSQGFTGSPKAVLVDGYPAVQDGPTIYIAASNRALQDSGPIYSNIYLISHNPDAKPTTLSMYDQLVSYLAFNINITHQGNVCVKDANDAPFTDPGVNGGRPLDCSADWQCAVAAPQTHCDSLKLKLTRDTQRITDFQALTEDLERAKTAQGQYPKASGGTYLQGFSTSLWNSWQAEIGSALGVSMPKDPVNHFLSCGRCASDNKPCQTNADCASVQGNVQACVGGSLIGATWTSNADIDPQSCWNQKEHQYVCPNLYNPSQPAGASRIYQYRSLSGGTRWDLGAEFEVPPPADLSNWWSPALPKALYRCVTTSTRGNYCMNSQGQPDDSLCRSCPNGNCFTCQSGSNKGQSCTTATAVQDCGASVACLDNTVPVVQGACRQYGGTYTFTGICQNVPNGQNGTCGDGVLNTGEICEIGMTQTVSCTAGGQKGFKQQICDPATCLSYVDDVQHPQCLSGIQCGNARIDKACNKDVTKPCLTDSNCSGGVTCQPVEVCDDGALNGTYGHCNAKCQDYASYCGDGQISPGEICDNGSQNGAWHPQFVAAPASCSIDCKGAGPYCGDKAVASPEECDGNTPTTQSAICTAGNINQSCTSNADCGTGGICGGGAVAPVGYYDNGAMPHDADSCIGITKTVNGFKRATQHTRTCGAPGSATACKLTTWTSCQPMGMCGDGVLDTGEACDDGSNNGDTKACTTQCQKNICGDGHVNQGVEECDNGDQNGQATCSADYNSMCLSCSKLCKFQATAGGYCGDKQKNGPEQCDGSVPSGMTCQSLGYDYAMTPAGVSCTNSCIFGGCARCSDTPGTSSIQGRVYDAVFQQVVPGARVSLLYKGVKVDEAFTDNDGHFQISTLNANSACGGYRIVIDMYQDNPCTGTSTTSGVSCYAGHVPSWTYPYNVDEGVLGGYFSYTSDLFSATTFGSVMNGQDVDGVSYHVDIFPRPDRGRLYTAVTWDPNVLKVTSMKLHVVLPKESAYTVTGASAVPSTAGLCNYDARPASNGACARDLNWRSVGSFDLAHVPNARLLCLHRVGEVTSGWVDPKSNGCPIEGTTQCIANYKAYATAHPPVPQNLNAAANAACAVDANHSCPADPRFDDCSNPAHYGPLTGYVNYLPLNQAQISNSISFYFLGYLFGPSSVGQPSGPTAVSAAAIKQSSNSVRAYVVFTSITGNSEIHQLAGQNASGSGWAWHIADFDPLHEKLSLSNEMKGSNTDAQDIVNKVNAGQTPAKPISGLGIWNYWFQGAGQYCVLKSDHGKLNADHPVCFTSAEKSACTGAYECGTWSKFHLYNW